MSTSPTAHQREDLGSEGEERTSPACQSKLSLGNPSCDSITPIATSATPIKQRSSFPQSGSEKYASIQTPTTAPTYQDIAEELENVKAMNHVLVGRNQELHKSVLVLLQELKESKASFGDIIGTVMEGMNQTVREVREGQKEVVQEVVKAQKEMMLEMKGDKQEQGWLSTIFTWLPLAITMAQAAGIGEKEIREGVEMIQASFSSEKGNVASST